MMCEAVSVAIYHLPQIGLSLEEPALQGFFGWFSPLFSADFLWSISVPQNPGN
jgi:hypothetical protein